MVDYTTVQLYNISWAEQVLNLWRTWATPAAEGLLVEDKNLQSLCFKLPGFCLNSGGEQETGHLS